MNVENVIYTTKMLERDFEDMEATCTVWRRGNNITSVYANNTLYKNARSFGNVDRAYKTKEKYEEKGIDGYPSSPASVFSDVYKKAMQIGIVPYPRYKVVNKMLGDAGSWLWIEKRIKGRYSSPIYHVDLNNAYLWGSLRGLPKKIETYNGQQGYVGLIDVKSTGKELPCCLKSDDPVLLSHEDIKYYEINGDWKCRLGFNDLDVNLKPIFHKIDEWFDEYIFKKCTQMYWGLFAMTEGASGKKYENGKVKNSWETGGQMGNSVWATLITHRVMRRVHGLMQNGGIQCFVDSVLSPYKPRTSEKIGDWELKRHFENGVYIKAPGIYDGLPRSTSSPSDSWYRHSGIIEGYNKSIQERKEDWTKKNVTSTFTRMSV